MYNYLSFLDSFGKLANENKCVAYLESDGAPSIIGEIIPPSLNNDFLD